MIKFEINIQAVLALLHLAPKDDVRYYLNGVFVSTEDAGFVRYVATNGNVLGLYRDRVQTVEKPAATSLIINRGVFKSVKLQKHQIYGTLTIQDAEIVDALRKPRKCTLEYAGQSIEFIEVDGKFPDYMRVVHVTASGEPAQYNPEFLMSFVKAGEVLRGKKYATRIPYVMHNGAESGIVLIPDVPDFHGVIMPSRVDTGTIPAWLRKEAAEINIASTRKWLADLTPTIHDEQIAACTEKIEKLSSVLAVANAELCV